MAADGLWDVYTDQAMGALTDAGNAGEVQVSRADQDAFAARSHQRAAAATSQRRDGGGDRRGQGAAAARAATGWSRPTRGSARA